MLTEYISNILPSKGSQNIVAESMSWLVFAVQAYVCVLLEIFGVQANDKDLNSFSNLRSLGNSSKILYNVSTFILNLFIYQVSYKSIFDCLVFVIILNPVKYMIYPVKKLVKSGYYWPSINKSVRDLYRVYHVKNYNRR